MPAQKQLPAPPTISVPAVRDTALEAGMLSRLINERYAAVQVLHLLSDSCFYDTDHLRLFKAIRQLDVEGKEIDMLSVVDKLHDTLSPEDASLLVSRTASTVFANDEHLELTYMAVRLQEYARRRAVGKICEKLLKHGHHVAFYSMEMSAEKVTSRILSMECGVNSNALQRLRLTPFERDHALRAIQQLQDTVADHFYFDNRNIRDIDALTMSIRALKKQRAVDCIVVDYIQLMDAPPGQKTDTTNKTLGTIAHRLHDLAKELHVCILALSQINRAIQGEPNMAHLRDSGEIAEAADMVIILFNADFEHTTFPKPYADVDPKGKLLVKIEKNRDGATATFLVGFVSAETRIFALVESNGVQQEVPLFSYE